jgi:hypothetical protein
MASWLDLESSGEPFWEVPTPSKAVSEGPRRLPRGYLELFGDVLTLLGGILETRAFKIAPACWDRAHGPPR